MCSRQQIHRTSIFFNFREADAFSPCKVSAARNLFFQMSPEINAQIRVARNISFSNYSRSRPGCRRVW